MGRSRRDRPCPEDENLAEAGSEAAPARHRRRRLPGKHTARDPVRRWLGAKCEPNELRRWERVSAAVQADWRKRSVAVPPPCRSRSSGLPKTSDTAVSLSGITRVAAALSVSAP